mgnify:CR=1 FL=1
MINEYCVKAYCSEDISLIENYDLAIVDTIQTWHCHHRGEVLPCGRFSIYDLKKFGLYYKRPASELIFLTKAEHNSLHKRGVPKSEAHKKALSDALKGIPLSEEHKNALSEALKDVPKSEAHKKANSYAKKGVPIGPMCEAHKKAISEAQRGIPLSEAHKKAISDAMKGVNAKKILQFTKSGEFIKDWQSAYEAERELGIAQSNICRCCNGKYKSAGGFIWKYA